MAGQPTPLATAAASASWPWEREPAHEHSELATAETTASAPDPDQPTAGLAAIAPAPAVDLEEPAAVDPCSLVSGHEWAAWQGGAAAAVPEILEDGEACGWRSEGDAWRMAIGLLDARHGRFLPQGASGRSIAGLGHGATWVEGWPTEVASTLVVQLDGIELVLEMSARTAGDRAKLLDAARHFAAIAAERAR